MYARRDIDEGRGEASASRLTVWSCTSQNRSFPGKVTEKVMSKNHFRAGVWIFTFVSIPNLGFFHPENALYCTTIKLPRLLDTGRAKLSEPASKVSDVLLIRAFAEAA